jgi:DNA-binding HxlR family transcriptional regulator
MSKSQNTTADCPMAVALNIISGKWKLAILWNLTRGTVRFNELQRRLPKITQKTLAQQLRELERDNIIRRQLYPEVPPKVEYSLSALGETLVPILNVLCQWGKDYQKNQPSLLPVTKILEITPKQR